MNFEQLCNSTKEELAKKTKADLLTALEGKYAYSSKTSRVNGLEQELAVAKAPATELKKLLCGSLGKVLEGKSEWDKKADYDALDLSTLVGELIAKYTELLAK